MSYMIAACSSCMLVACMSCMIVCLPIKCGPSVVPVALFISNVNSRGTDGNNQLWRGMWSSAGCRYKYSAGISG